MHYLDTDTLFRNFTQMVNQDVYVDKSLLIEKLNKRINMIDHCICITKPRRFGKTYNLTMLGAYYTQGYDSEPLFKGLKIEQSDSFKQHLNLHHVIYIDFSQHLDECRNYRDYIESILNNLKEDLFKAYPSLTENEWDQIYHLFHQTNDRFIFLLDHYDALFYRDFVTQEDKKDYLQFLKDLLKDQPYVELAFMSGILPIPKYSIGSSLNMFVEYNFTNDWVYESFYGFDEREVKALCMKYPKVSYQELSDWYGGYKKNDEAPLFNPHSVVCALTNGVCINYWQGTGMTNEIAEVIGRNEDKVKEDIETMMKGNSVKYHWCGYEASQLQLNDAEEMLCALAVFGFLSYHDRELTIPNKETMEKFEVYKNKA